MTKYQIYLAEVKQRLEAATPGPWRWLNCNSLVADHGHRPVVLTTNDMLEVRGPDGTLHLLSVDGADPKLIAHAPDDIRKLLAMVEIMFPLCVGAPGAQSATPDKIAKGEA